MRSCARRQATGEEQPPKEARGRREPGGQAPAASASGREGRGKDALTGGRPPPTREASERGGLTGGRGNFVVCGLCWGVGRRPLPRRNARRTWAAVAKKGPLFSPGWAPYAGEWRCGGEAGIFYAHGPRGARWVSQAAGRANFPRKERRDPGKIGKAPQRPKVSGQHRPGCPPVLPPPLKKKETRSKIGLLPHPQPKEEKERRVKGGEERGKRGPMMAGNRHEGGICSGACVSRPGKLAPGGAAW